MTSNDEIRLKLIKSVRILSSNEQLRINCRTLGNCARYEYEFVSMINFLT